MVECKFWRGVDGGRALMSRSAHFSLWVAKDANDTLANII